MWAGEDEVGFLRDDEGKGRMCVAVVVQDKRKDVSWHAIETAVPSRRPQL